MTHPQTDTHKHTNRLIHESSPYLLQHAHNPVDWYPWGEEAFARAREEDKLIIVSIGYSACHWCHVMERECFEDELVAKSMNDNFICVKVDREERPDVDHLYMDAANIMVGRGGWPLNAFALPDGRPVYAGTYFPKPQWMGVLKELGFGYRMKKANYLEYAEKLLNGIKGLSVVEIPKGEEPFHEKDLKSCYLSFAQIFDRENGGKGRAPKFPMPDNYLFLLRYHVFGGESEALSHTLFTLDKMAGGGIYDQLGGGFARYSVDEAWRVPHFEKMLYDNAQLLSLYSEGYQAEPKPLYKEVVYRTIEWVEREMLAPDGGFYAALDAESEGVEGKFYTWTNEDFAKAAGEDTELLSAWYGIGKEAFWEEEHTNVLQRPLTLDEVATQRDITPEAAEKKIEEGRKRLLDVRNERIRPGLDDKIILGWNALMLNGLLDAWKVFREPRFLALAENCLAFLHREMVQGNRLYRTWKNGKPAIPGFLEDYALYIRALLTHYQLCFRRESLDEAVKLTEYVMEEFADDDKPLFSFSGRSQTDLATRKIEHQDNVIPSGNSVMAHNLFVLGQLLDKAEYRSCSDIMLRSVLPQVTEFGPFYSNWGMLLAYRLGPYYEVAILGEDAAAIRLELEEVFSPNKLCAGSPIADETIPLLAGRFRDDQNLIYVCENFTCARPVHTAEEALPLLRSK